MALKASEISTLIKERIENFEASAEARDVGTVIAVTDGIVRIHGLADARYGEMLEFPGNTFGMALNLEQDSVGAVVLGDYKHISEGDAVKCTGRVLEVPTGPELLGLISRDPYLASIDVLESLSPAELSGEPWVAANGNAVLLAETAAASIDIDAQARAVNAVRAGFEALPGSAALTLDITGVGAFSVELQETIRAEATLRSVLV